MVSALFQTLRKQLGQTKHRILSEAGARAGSVREQERFGLLPRPNYAYGMLRAADLARFVGVNEVTVCEFGVATGNGLMAMVSLAERLQPETGVQFRIVGFDTGAGLPQIGGFEDHPELWSAGDFSMENKETLIKELSGRAELIFGDIKDTVPGFLSSLSKRAPLGFVSVDVDIYSASRSALGCLLGPAECYVPAVSMYFDDVSFFFANRWCGELRAIDEFNEQNQMRKIDHDRSKRFRTSNGSETWYGSMYVAHILDHECRSRPVQRKPLDLQEHLQFMQTTGLC